MFSEVRPSKSLQRMCIITGFAQGMIFLIRFASRKFLIKNSDIFLSSKQASCFRETCKSEYSYFLQPPEKALKSSVSFRRQNEKQPSSPHLLRKSCSGLESKQPHFLYESQYATYFPQFFQMHDQAQCEKMRKKLEYKEHDHLNLHEGCCISLLLSGNNHYDLLYSAGFDFQLNDLFKHDSQLNRLMTVVR